ncbi:MAG: polyheme membrane-associated cytochrome C [Rhodobacter sp.]|nr:polyheme membrane-associated cytochrome C [Rhodobacter sp.]
MRHSFSWLTGAVLVICIAGLTQAQDQASRENIVAEWASSAHADAAAEAFTHWNDEGEIPDRCALCHAGAGLRSFYGFDGSTAGEVPALPTGGVVDCDTCHVAGAMTIAEVRFPSGTMLSAPFGNGTCFTCHQGRQSGPGVATALEGKEDDTVDPEIRFLNPHYKAAAATMHGGVAQGMYEYPGKDYADLYAHAPEPLCTSCHSPHSLEVQTEALCSACHRVDDPKAIRVSTADFDGDGDTAEGIHGEIATLHAQLGAAILDYGRDTAGTPVVYSAGRYPYFFTDTDADGEEDEGEAAYPNRYASWTPRMLRAAYNYQFVAKDPGAYAHNPDYVLQVLIDTLEDLTGSTGSALIRPE